MPEKVDRAPTRRLTVIAQDPRARVRGKVLTARVVVPSEYLRPGPAGHRVHVVDYDASADRLLVPAALGDDDGFADSDPNELSANPAFHAQNVYAIVMSVLARFERALGRRVRWGFLGHQIKVLPHAFADANAYYSRDDEALMFGYFPGGRGPVFTCLSHDIVAHEATHALLDGLRRNFLLPSSPEQAGFHEGFADVVALLSVFHLREVVDAALRPADAHLRDGFVIDRDALTVELLGDTMLGTLAEEMGAELSGGRGRALRRSMDLWPSERWIRRFTEPHELGEVLVAAMLRSFLEVWVRRLFPHGNRGVRALDRAHVVDEGATAADHLLTMAIRALDYTPPVDLHFGDFLSALLTADAEVNPDDSRYGYRDIVTRVFASYGIAPSAASSADAEGRWHEPPSELSYDGTSLEEMQRDPEAVFRFVWQNREELGLEESAYTWVESVRPTVRTNGSGFVVHETVAEYVQVLDLRADELAVHGIDKPRGMRNWQRVRLHGGAALIFDDRGRLKFNVGSSVRSRRQSARLAYLFGTGQFDSRGAVAVDLSRAHRLRAGAPDLRDPYLERSAR